MTPIECYRVDLEREDFQYDRAQEHAIIQLQKLYEELTYVPRLRRSFLSRFATKRSHGEPVKGLYLWGGVGRGKTYLADLFFDCLPFAEKKRTHFHRFMHKIHGELRTLRDQRDPLAIIGERFARSARVLCFDEFIVNDIADAMILAGLLKALFSRGVTLVATSNIPPEELYEGGLQRDRFVPAIDLIRRHADVVQVDGGTDYRLQFLDRAEIFFHPLDERAHTGLANNFEHIAPEFGHQDVTLEVDGRDIRAVRRADGVVWFDFEEICGGPRSQSDYIELSRCFHTILLSNIPRLTAEHDDQARRLINLIDVMYDRNVKLIASAAHAPEALYTGTRLGAEFRRTASRMIEMQSHDYLARKHLS